MKEGTFKSAFTQGYIAAISCFIKGHGMGTEVRETYRAGIGKSTLKQLKANGVDEYDLQILKEHWKELNKKS